MSAKLPAVVTRLWSHTTQDECELGAADSPDVHGVKVMKTIKCPPARKEPKICYDTNQEAEVVQRIFLVGCARSGTTLLQSMLMSHSEVHSFPETHFFERAFSGWRSSLKRLLWGGRFAQRLLASLQTDLHHHEAVQGDLMHLRSFGAGIAEYRKLLDRITLANGKIRWIEKTPGHLHQLGVITRSFPSSQFLHLIRDGRAVVASLYEVSRKYPRDWGGPRGIQDCVREWNNCLSESARWVGRSGHSFVFYEDLVQNPNRELTRLSNLLGVGFELEMITGFQEVAEHVVAGGEDWKANNTRPVFDHGLEKFRTVFTSGEQREIEEELRLDLYKRLRLAGTAAEAQ